MQKLIPVIFFLVLCPAVLLGQYVNSDSLYVVSGFQEPVTLTELDSLKENSYAFETVSNEYFAYRSHVPGGQIMTQFGMPSAGKVISRFGPRNGRMHTGTDIKLNKGDTIYAAFNGKVTRARYYYGYGNMVVVEHSNNIETYYAHLSGYLTTVGESVVKGQPVGLAGSTGRATTNHLHFEIRENNKPFDPELVYDFDNRKIREEVKFANNLTGLHSSLNQTGYSVNEPSPQHYRVRNGDSLWIISRRFKTSVKTLCALNNLNENSVLRVGMTLKIY